MTAARTQAMVCVESICIGHGSWVLVAPPGLNTYPVHTWLARIPGVSPNSCSLRHKLCLRHPLISEPQRTTTETSLVPTSSPFCKASDPHPPTGRRRCRSSASILPCLGTNRPRVATEVFSKLQIPLPKSLAPRRRTSRVRRTRMMCEQFLGSHKGCGL